MEQYLKGKKVYLSGSIHSCSNDGVEWRESIAPRIERFGLEVLDPCKTMVNNNSELSEIGKNKAKFRDLIMAEDWAKVKQEFWPIVRKDLRCVDHCDFLIFNYEPLKPMVGTIHELCVAQLEKKPILLLYKKSDLLHFNPWVCTFIKSHHFFSEIDFLVDYLKEVNDGIFDTSLWVV